MRLILLTLVAILQGVEPTSTPALPDSESTSLFIVITGAVFLLSTIGYGLWQMLSSGSPRKSPYHPASQSKVSPREVYPPPNPPLKVDKLQDVSSNQPSEPLPAKVSVARPTIFISYRRGDTGDITGRIYDRLVQHFGKHSVFKDVDSIPLGVDFRKRLGDSVGQCDVLLAIIGRQWLSSEASRRGPDDPRDYVRIEIEAALQRDIPVIPILVQGAFVPEEEDLPPTLQTLAYRNGISVRPDPDFHQDVDRLIRGIETHLNRNDKG